MKKLLLVAAFTCLTALTAHAQQSPSVGQPFVRTFVFDASENSPCYRVNEFAVQYHQIIFRPLGTVSGGTIKLSGYASNDCQGSATDIIAATAWTAADETALTHGSYGSVRMVGASYSGTGTIVATYLGYMVHTGVIDETTGAFLVEVEGLQTDPAHDAPDTGNPVKTGFRAVSFGATPTAVAAADRSDWLGSRAGMPFVLPGHPNIVTLEAQIEDADGAQTNAAIVTVSSGTKIVVTGVAAHCDASTTGPTNIVVGFGTSTLPSRAAGGTAGILAGFDGVPAGGGMVKGFNGAILGVGADDEDVRITTEDPAGGACSVEISYFTIAG